MELKATALGNHEWDAKKKGLIAYIKNSNFPFVVANLERKKEEEIQLIISKLNAVNDAEKIAEHKISLEKEISDYKSRVFKT